MNSENGAMTAQKLTLPTVFSSNMVIQRGKRIHVWGSADQGGTVRVELANQYVATVAEDGKWEVWLNPMEGGGPHDLVISSKDEQVRFENVLIGDVWVLSGQSNMGHALCNVIEGPGELIQHQLQQAKMLANPSIRLFFPTIQPSDQPLTDYQSNGWQICSLELAASFSAVGYFFGGYLQQSIGVPIGLVQLAQGSTSAQVWISKDALHGSRRLQTIYDYTKQKEVGVDFRQPAWLYNGMIAPLHGFPVKGVVWYQGERNASTYNPEDYGLLMSTLIRDWRAGWNDDLPFILVQLPSYKNPRWPVIRNEQQKAAAANTNVGLVVTIDLGDPENLHPKDKMPVGYRVSLQARSLAYGENIVCSGPTLKSAKLLGGKVHIAFEDFGGGLISTKEQITGFRLHNEGGASVPAQAVFADGHVVVWSSEALAPTAVSYGWSGCPGVSLFNNIGLPVAPFLADLG